jgi:hypothetical protein
MVQWNDGYVSDVVYTSNFYGVSSPDLAKPFAYADLGCGNGITALVVAATCLSACGSLGVRFQPGTRGVRKRTGRPCRPEQCAVRGSPFAEPEAMPNPRLPDFDIIVSHGVASWISPANRRRLIGTIADVRHALGYVVFLPNAHEISARKRVRAARACWRLADEEGVLDPTNPALPSELRPSAAPWSALSGAERHDGHPFLRRPRVRTPRWTQSSPQAA